MVLLIIIVVVIIILVPIKHHYQKHQSIALIRVSRSPTETALAYTHTLLYMAKSYVELLINKISNYTHHYNYY